MAEDRFILVTAHGELSSAEVASHLETVGIDYRIDGTSNQALILHAAGLDAERVMERLGGLYKIGSVRCTMDREDVRETSRMRKKLDATRFYGWLDEKARWCVSAYGDKTGFDRDLIGFLQEYFQERLKQDGVRRARYILSKKVAGADQEIVSDELIKKRIIDGGLEIVAAQVSGRYYIGRTLQVVRSQEFKRRDLGRPVQNPKLTVPPKIARILVNLTGLGADETLLDPFCGIGTILQEAAILGLQIVGSDIDGRRISETKRNLRWLSETYGLKMDNLSERIFKADVRHLSQRLRIPVDGIATEPILLPPLKRFPSEEEATEMLRRSAETYEAALPAMAAVLRKAGRLVLVAPSVRTDRRSEASFNLDEVFEEAGLTLYRPRSLPRLRYPLMASSDKDQKVMRGIYVLEKR